MTESQKTQVKELQTRVPRPSVAEICRTVGISKHQYKRLTTKLNKKKERLIEHIETGPHNILVIGDLHLPFEREGYFEFCREVYLHYRCDHVIFIGDILDNHYASYHTTDPDGMGGKDELTTAVEKLGKWIKQFPKADVCIGNHDANVMRKAFDGQIPSVWIRDFKEVLGCPGWSWADEHVYDGVQYIHGIGGHAATRAKRDVMSTVQGHWHQLAYTQHFVGYNQRYFAMQVGCGIDHKSMAFAYAKNHPKPAIGCGVVLHKGLLPVNVLMTL